jgi:predicted nuclease of restriction endonuclease-like (RecB) superfamily
VSTNFINKLKQKILVSRYSLAKIANAEMLSLYFTVGKMVEDEIEANNWGDKILDAISFRLQKELPGLRGFSASNLKKMRIFHNAWKANLEIGSLLTNQIENCNTAIGSSVTNQIEKHDISLFVSISFTHHLEIILKSDNIDDYWFYIKQTSANFWSVQHLRTELKNRSHLNHINKSNNFKLTLSKDLSNKAIRAFKDQYLLDYINVEDADDEIDERVLEQEIMNNIRKFLMSLGNEFCFMGNQFRLIVDDEEIFIDLLFFHRGLQSLVAFDLKKGKFKPEYVGKMNFYLSALDDLVKQPHESASIGIILCKEKNNKKVEYSFRDFSKPMGVSVYKTSETLPPELRKALPDAETLKKLME